MDAPPRLARRLLSFALTPEDRDDILANLDELHQHRTRNRGRRFAAAWYWRDALALAISFGRLRDGPGPSRLGFRSALKAAGRSFVRAPRPAAAATLTLAMGIAISTLAFALAWQTVLRPSPFPDAGRLEWVGAGQFQLVTRRQFKEFGRLVGGRIELTAMSSVGYSLNGANEPGEVTGLAASTNHFEVFGLAPALGRAFREEDGLPGADPVALISQELWRDQFGGDSAVLGRRIDLYQAAAIPMIPGAFAGARHLVIGVLPPRYAPSGFRPAVVTPLIMDPGDGSFGNLTELQMVGRLRPGVPRAEADRAIRKVIAEIPLFEILREGADGPVLGPLQAVLTGPLRPAMIGAVVAAGLVLLIACANVVNLLLVRLRNRDRELAVRTALGADRDQLITLLLAEGVVLSVAAGLVGTALAFALEGRLAAMLPPEFQPGEFTVAGAPLVLSLAAGLLVTIVCGLVPALSLGRGRSQLPLGARAVGAHRAGARWTSVLIAGEIGLALVVTYSSFALGFGLLRLRRAELGFVPEHLHTMRLAPVERRYRDPDLRRLLVDGLLERARAIPGVEAAGAIHFLPIADAGPGLRFHPGPPDGSDPVGASYRVITPGYLETMGIAIEAGRAVSEADAVGGDPVGLVNGTMARRYWPGESAIGKRLYRTSGELLFTVVGVIADVRQNGLAIAPEPELYLPLHQTAWASAMTIVVRSREAQPLVATALRDIVRSIDPNLPITRVATMDAIVRASTATDRMLTVVFGIFAMLSLGLAAIGVFSVAAAAAIARRREIGLRLAIGATAGGILRGELLRAGRVAAIGIAVGVLGAIGGAPLIDSLIQGGAPMNPVLLAAVSALLAAIVAGAVALPAQRAAQIEPTAVLARDG